MIENLIIDSRFFSTADLAWQKELVSVCSKSNIYIAFPHIPEKGYLHQRDLAAMVGASCAVVSLVISLLNLLKQPTNELTLSRLLEEITAFLSLKGIIDFSIEDTVGFQNLIDRNGNPCIVKVRCPNGISLLLFVGLKGKSLIISPVEYDARSL